MISAKDILNFQDMLIACGMILKKIKSAHENSYTLIGTQVKSIADQEAHKYLTSHIKKIRKGSLIISEEDAQRVPAHTIEALDECFIIDPIDGTASFVHGYPGYVVQMAYLRKGIPVFSVVYAPDFDDMYVAIKGEGAYLNNKKIKIKKGSKQTIYIDNYPKPSAKIEKMMQFQKQSTYMECGSIGLKICKVADGSANFFYKDVILRDWDFVPPALILEEAGGYLLSLTKEKIHYFSNDDYSHQGLIAVSNLKLLSSLDCLDNRIRL